MPRCIKTLIVVVANRAVLVCAFIAWVMFAVPAWPGASQATSADYSCTYSAKAKGDVLQFERCAWSDGSGHIHLKREHRLALDFDRYGLARVNIGGGWYYVGRDSRLAPVMTMDNWAEPFADGLARSHVGNKIGFINRNLVLVIPPRYDGALPFEHGWAEVCIDCKLASQGEHSWYEGGRWAALTAAAMNGSHLVQARVLATSAGTDRPGLMHFEVIASWSIQLRRKEAGTPNGFHRTGRRDAAL